LSKEYNNLWVFGDSYTTPHRCVTPQESFWGLAAQYLGIPAIKNCSRDGNSLDSVCHMLISMQDQYNWDKDVFLIGIPPLERITIFDNFKDTEYTGYKFDTDTWDDHKFKITSHHGLVSEHNYGNDKQLVIHSDRSWLETQTLRTLFLLTTWLDSKNANYLIVNLSKPFDPENKWGPSDFVLPYCQEHKRCILFENTYYSTNLNKHEPADFKQYGWMGHHGPAGNSYFFETSIKDRLC
jgi:hypothetical protein